MSSDDNVEDLARAARQDEPEAMEQLVALARIGAELRKAPPVRDRLERIADRLRAITNAWQRGDGLPSELDDLADQISDLGSVVVVQQRVSDDELATLRRYVTTEERKKVHMTLYPEWWAIPTTDPAHDDAKHEQARLSWGCLVHSRDAASITDADAVIRAIVKRAGP